MLNATPAAGAPSRSRPTVPEMVAAHAAGRPETVAVSDATGDVCYAELWARAGALADQLRTSGVAHGDIVAVCLERSADAVVACTGVLAAGAAYLLLDPDQPPVRVRDLLAESTAKTVVTRPEHARRLGLEAYGCVDAGAFRDVRADAALRVPAGPEADGAADAPAGDSLAYLNFTSGSTGRPKGVLIGHRGLSNLVTWYRDRYRVGPGDRTSQLARPTFDAFVLETWTALAAGASLYIAPPEVITYPERLRDWLCSTGITVSFVPTALAERLFALDWPGRADGCALRDLLVGGDRLTRRPPAGLPFRVHNNYGPTENTVVATVGVVEPQGDDRDARGDDDARVDTTGAATALPSIGEPLPGVTAHVLDSGGGPVADGEPGRLHLGGIAVALGYLHGSGYGGAFLPDPFADLPGARMYDTGDRVVRDAEGRFHFLGRDDDQVQIRGFRVEPAEVEAALRAHEAVDGAVVVATDEDEARLVGYVTPRDGTADPREIRGRVADQLPDYMVPARVVAVAAFPLTPQGKVDRTALAALPLGAGDAGSDGTGEEAGPLLSLLRALWAEVLVVPSVSIDDDFFEIGGDSLRVIRLVGKARRQGLKLRPEDVYNHPVLSELARAVAPADPGATGTPTPVEGTAR